MYTGDTALMYAARNGHIDIVRYLVEDGGVNVNAVNEVSDDVNNVYYLNINCYTMILLIIHLHYNRVGLPH